MFRSGDESSTPSFSQCLDLYFLPFIQRHGELLTLEFFFSFPKSSYCFIVKELGFYLVTEDSLNDISCRD
jgi:hypothetical protein